MHNAQPPGKRYKAPHKQNNHIQGTYANEEPQNSEFKKPKHQKTNSTHLYQRKQEKKKSIIREGEWKPTTEKSELKFETRNNLPNLQNIHEGKHYLNLEWHICEMESHQRHN